MEVEGVFRRQVQIVSRFDELWPQRIEGHLRGLEIPVVSLRKTIEPLPDGVVERVRTNGLLQVANQHLSHNELTSRGNQGNRYDRATRRYRYDTGTGVDL